MMAEECCAVTVRLSMPDAQFAKYYSAKTAACVSLSNSTLEVSVSGLMLLMGDGKKKETRRAGAVLCHGGVFSNVLPSDYYSQHQHQNKQRQNKDIAFSVLVHQTWFAARLIALGSVPCAAERVAFLARADRDVRVGWDWNTAGRGAHSDDLASRFCVLQLHNHPNSVRLGNALRCQDRYHFSQEHTTLPVAVERGCQIAVVSSPLGVVSPLLFHNAYQEGNVCTMLSQEVWLSDVACVAGAEGGVVLARDGSHCHSHQTTQEVLGMVCMPVGIRDVGAYTMLVGMRAVMRWANQHLPALPLSMQVPQTNTQHMQHTLTSPALTAERCVVQIAHGLSWGSGVCVSPQGHIITARHVVAHAHARQELIRVRTSAGWHSQQQQQQQRQDGQGRGEGAELGGGAQANESWMQARVVSVSSGPWDIALLQVVDPGVAARREIKEVCLRPGELCHALDIYRGQAVCNVGFGLLSPPVAASASISRGTISKYVPGTAIVADASVYSGCSGGALLDSASGKLLGLTTMTLRINPIAKSSQESSEQQVPRVHILPKIALSIPAPVLARFLRPDFSTTPSSFRPSLPAFRALNDDDARILEVWNLEYGLLLGETQPTVHIQVPSKL